ncbi:c-type cytochrome [Marinobacter caseinilyticus]|uniref:c-type cytochrome n=1 Tax=Marinobacter caseinilyticus TaxID=2692195 RepID=UPI001A940897|nr:hypothetical protein [Marinobacter caseinilyticus]
MKGSLLLAVTLSLCAILPAAMLADSSSRDQAQIDRGRYLIMMSGCNDCHSSGYMPSEGTLPESQWLMGDTLGWHGPWGTTYPINLRLFASQMDEDEWVSVVTTAKPRPPMPWWALHEMEEQDVRAIYAFIRSLPVEGTEAPAALEPGVTPKTAYFQLVEPQEE